MKYIIDKALNLQNDAGFKARIDVINILKQQGYEYVPIKEFRNGVLERIKSLNSILKVNFEENSTVVVQYPLNAYWIKILLIKAKSKNCNLVCLIHDIESLRNQLSSKKIKKEILQFNKFNFIISHNTKMSKWLLENGLKSKVYELELFDYLANKSVISREIGAKFRITYATGILGKQKSAFLFDINSVLGENCELVLYGGIEERLKKIIEQNNKIKYYGPLDPNLISEKIEGNFGLIWDSEHLDKCTGSWANYTRFNNPHKLSMYIAANLPAIAWKQSAIARFIEENNIGICVNNLFEIKSELSKLDAEQYEIMKNNIKNISEKIRGGFYTKKIVDTIE